MAVIRNEEVNGRIRTTVHLEPGERIKLCRCHKSAEYPLCDHAHKQLDGNIGPVVIFASLEEAKTEDLDARRISRTKERGSHG